MLWCKFYCYKYLYKYEVQYQNACKGLEKLQTHCFCWLNYRTDVLNHDLLTLLENFIKNEKEEELIIIRNVQLNRLQLKKQLIELYADENLLQHQLNVTLLDAHSMKEEGSGVGISKKIYLNFFIE